MEECLRARTAGEDSLQTPTLNRDYACSSFSLVSIHHVYCRSKAQHIRIQSSLACKSPSRIPVEAHVRTLLGNLLVETEVNRQRRICGARDEVDALLMGSLYYSLVAVV
ncbi:hypothetical protein E2C01_098588 [Portunus trituberculatus]|uniref:Uncharacterized protein n=1 Tax=Portunus trituberculatus TaxID=210409 RepID=A0A5B7K8S8_PORTR|nr:hypothetical protein [Portunus trituberculatus]